MYIKFYSSIAPDQLLVLWEKEHHLTLKQITKENDQLGILHEKYQQYIDTLPVEWAECKLHLQENRVLSFSGLVWKNLSPLNSPNITANQAIQIALAHHPAEQYFWEDSLEESLYKSITNNPYATYYPKPKLMYYKTPEVYALVYKLTIYSKNPLSKKKIII